MSIFGIFFAPIPRPLWSEYSGVPFVRCIDCEVPLLEANAYLIQKKFVAGEAIFEMAMCERCRDRMAQAYSEETRRNIIAYMAEQFCRNAAADTEGDEGEEPRVVEISEIEDPEEGARMLRRCLDYCLMCGTERKKCHRYSLAGLCRDNEVVAQVTPVSQTPVMVCDKCEQGMDNLISQQTRDSWDRFVEEHFDGPPGVESDVPGSYPMVF